MTIKLSETNIDILDIQIFTQQHENLKRLVKAQNLDNLKAQMNNALQVFKDLRNFKGSWLKSDFFWSDKKILRFLKDEVHVIRVVKNKIGKSKERSFRIWKIAKIVQDAVMGCIKNHDKNRNLINTINNIVNELESKKKENPATEYRSKRKIELRHRVSSAVEKKSAIRSASRNNQTDLQYHATTTIEEKSNPIGLAQDYIKDGNYQAAYRCLASFQSNDLNPPVALLRTLAGKFKEQFNDYQAKRCLQCADKLEEAQYLNEKFRFDPSSKDKVSDFTQIPERVKPNKKVNILTILLSAEDEPVPEIYKKAKEFIEVMSEGANQLLSEGIDFKTAEKLKQTKKAAKDFLIQEKSCFKATREALRQVIEQYDYIVESVFVLSILREISREIRKPQMEKVFSRPVPYQPITKSFSNILGSNNTNSINYYDEKVISDLTEAYATKDKVDDWKKMWTVARQKIWDASNEAARVIKEKKTITFCTGSKSSSLPTILKIGQLAPGLADEPALVPTGQLFCYKIPPMSGELGYGIEANGINQTKLSGCDFEDLHDCIRYATDKDFQFDTADEELERIMGITKLNRLIPTLRVSVLRLLRLNAKKESYEKIKNHIRNLIEQRPKEENMSIAPLWSQQAGLLDHVCKEKVSPCTGDLRRGQVVAIPMAGSDYPKYAIVCGKYKEDIYKLIVDKEGTVEGIKSTKIFIVPDHILQEQAKKYPPLKELEESHIQEKIKNEWEKLEDILNYFTTVPPYDLTPEELGLIQDPFPIVWASFSTDLPYGGVHSSLKEMPVKGKMVLGKDIQIVFTPRENIDKLKACLKDQQVQVLSFEAAHFIRGYQEYKKFRKQQIPLTKEHIYNSRACELWKASAQPGSMYLIFGDKSENEPDTIYLKQHEGVICILKVKPSDLYNFKMKYDDYIGNKEYSKFACPIAESVEEAQVIAGQLDDDSHILIDEPLSGKLILWLPGGHTVAVGDKQEFIQNPEHVSERILSALQSRKIRKMHLESINKLLK